MLDFANTRTKSGSTVVFSDDATKLVAALGAGIKDAATADLLAQVKRTPEFRRLEAGVQGFRKAAESSTLGVWIDRKQENPVRGRRGARGGNGRGPLRHQVQQPAREHRRRSAQGEVR